MKTNKIDGAARTAALEKNFSRMFWIQACMGFKILNVVISIFYVHRGLTLQQIFFLGVVFAVTNLIFEIPSSYAADRWGRKKTIAVALLCMAVSSVFDFFSHGFLLFVVDIIFYGVSYAFLSGTDDALIYDTVRELGRDKDSLKELGSYYSAQRFFKIVTPLLGVFIAKDLLDWQFQIIIALEFITTMIGLPLVFLLTEPKHFIEVERVEVGIMTDAWRLVHRNRELVRTILSRTTIFIASFLVWRIHQEYFISKGINILALGIMWFFVNIVGYIAAKNVTSILPWWSSVKKINVLNILFTITICGFAVTSFFNSPWVLLTCFALLETLEVARWPFFSDIFNKHSKSFNRATTLSLTNFIKSVLDVPLTLAAAWLVSFNPSYVFVFVAFVSVLVVVCIPVKEIIPKRIVV